MQEDEQLLQNWQGKQLGSYRLIRLVGRGGFAEVYQGEHVHLQTSVAIKVLQMRLTRQDQESFLSEAQIVASLRHPNIIRVLEFGVEESIPYLVMDYAPGGTLRQRYQSGVILTPLRILPYFKQLASALQYAHDQRVVHRDIKPENMLLGTDGELLLADFGIALGVQSSRSHRIEDIAGTVTYMAPELLRGRVIPASDQYALAVVIYEWLSGAPPFRGTFIEVASQHLFRAPPPLRQPSVSNEVEQVVLTALNKDPKRRFAHILEFATAFEQAALLGSTEETIKGKPRQPEQTEQSQKLAAQQAGSALVRENKAVAQSSAAHPAILPELMATSVQAGVNAASSSALTYVIPPVRCPRFQKLMLISIIVLAVLLCTEAVSFGAALVYLGATSLSVPTQQSPGNWQVSSLSDKQAQVLYEQATSNPAAYASTMAANDRYQWLTERNTAGSCLFAGGAYHIAVTALNMPQNCEPASATVSDFALQAQLTIVSGDSSGLAFRVNSKEGGYFFGIDKEGSYSLAAIVRGSVYMLLLGSSTAIVTGLNRPNLLTVIAQGTSILLYVNRHYVGGVTNSASSSGFFSVFAWKLTSGVGTTEVVCRGVQIWKLSVSS
jgi:serine/threonine protein kinase